MEFLDKKFLITGASSGIGKSSAELLIQKGATVVLLGRSPKKLKSIFGNQNNKNILIYEFDLKNYVDLPKLIRKICKNIGKLDGIFHSAGNHSALGINGLNNSILGHLFITTDNPAFSATCAASLLITPICPHKTFAPMSIA